jgi:hypothetical protein
VGSAWLAVFLLAAGALRAPAASLGPRCDAAAEPATRRHARAPDGAVAAAPPEPAADARVGWVGLSALRALLRHAAHAVALIAISPPQRPTTPHRELAAAARRAGPVGTAAANAAAAAYLAGLRPMLYRAARRLGKVKAQGLCDRRELYSYGIHAVYNVRRARAGGAVRSRSSARGRGPWRRGAGAAGAVARSQAQRHVHGPRLFPAPCPQPYPLPPPCALCPRAPCLSVGQVSDLTLYGLDTLKNVRAHVTDTDGGAYTEITATLQRLRTVSHVSAEWAFEPLARTAAAASAAADGGSRARAAGRGRERGWYGREYGLAMLAYPLRALAALPVLRARVAIATFSSNVSICLRFRILAAAGAPLGGSGGGGGGGGGRRSGQGDGGIDRGSGGGVQADERAMAWWLARRGRAENVWPLGARGGGFAQRQPRPPPRWPWRRLGGGSGRGGDSGEVGAAGGDSDAVQPRPWLVARWLRAARSSVGSATRGVRLSMRALRPPRASQLILVTVRIGQATLELETDDAAYALFAAPEADAARDAPPALWRAVSACYRRHLNSMVERELANALRDTIDEMWRDSRARKPPAGAAADGGAGGGR